MKNLACGGHEKDFASIVGASSLADLSADHHHRVFVDFPTNRALTLDHFWPYRSFSQR